MLVALDELDVLLRRLFEAQRYAVLGTQGADGVRLNLMAIVVADDLRSVVFATQRATLKYANLQCQRQVCLLVDNRTNACSDTQTAMALTVEGLAVEIDGAGRKELERLYLSRHRQLESFVRSPTCALFRVRVQRYELVRGLDDVRVVLMT